MADEAIPNGADVDLNIAGQSVKLKNIKSLCGRCGGGGRNRWDIRQQWWCCCCWANHC